MQAQQQRPAPPAAAAAVAAAPAPHVTQTPGNRFGFESADGQYSIALTGRLHFDAGDYIDYNKNSKATSPTDLQSGFNARRARLGVTGKFAGDWGYNFIYDFGGSSDGSMGRARPAAAAVSGGALSGIEERPYVTYNGLNQGPLPLAFDIGYQDTPFTLDEATSSNDIMFMERASAQAVASNIFANDFRSAAGVRSNDSRYWAGVYVTGPVNRASAHLTAADRSSSAAVRPLHLSGSMQDAGAMSLHFRRRCRRAAEAGQRHHDGRGRPCRQDQRLRTVTARRIGRSCASTRRRSSRPARSAPC